MASALSAPHFHNEEAAYAYVEARIWPEGPVCPHCGGLERIGKMGGRSTRSGTYKCYQCRKPFTVKIGTIFEDSKVAMNVWLQAIYLIAGSKKGISSNQLHRTLGVTLKTAWFMSHRIREAMRSNDPGFFGEGGGIVEADETFIGREKGRVARQGYHHKMKVLALVDRETGRSRAMVVDSLAASAIAPILFHNLSREARLFTDEATHYVGFSSKFADHQTTTHGKGEYVRGDIHTNTIEGYFSIFKRGMKGIYQHCAKKHLHRYLAEFDFRYTNRAANGFNDTQRADALLSGIVGRRLTYQRSHAGA
jgi:transposase-like protein